MKLQTIKFHGHDFVLIGDLSDGEIATAEAFESGAPGYAHVFPDQTIKQFGQVIGSVADIEVTGEYMPQHSDEHYSELLAKLKAES
jgi:hypothetical protein